MSEQKITLLKSANLLGKDLILNLINTVTQQQANPTNSKLNVKYNPKPKPFGSDKYKNCKLN